MINNTLITPVREQNFTPDLIREVFRWLPNGDFLNCRRVCKTWRDASNDKSAWINRLFPLVVSITSLPPAHARFLSPPGLGHSNLNHWDLLYDEEHRVVDINKAADEGFASAQYELARRTGFAKSIGWLIKASNQNHAKAQHYLSDLYKEGKGVEKDPEKASKLLWLAAENGDVVAQYCLAEELSRTDDENINTDVFKWYHVCAKKGYEDAEIIVGGAYEKGLWGVEKNEKKAVKWYARAAEKEWNAKGQCQLARCYEEGIGVETDMKVAAKWYHEAAGVTENDQPSCWAYEAMYALGRLYEEGLGVEKNPEEAFKWYNLARTSHCADYYDLYYVLGRFYESGIGVAMNFEKAVECYRKEKTPEAYVALAKLLEQGKGVDKNEAEAANLYAEAAKSGHAEALAKVRSVHLS